MAERDSEIENAVWALVFFGVGVIIFMNRTAIDGPAFIIAGTISFIIGCVFVARLLIWTGK